MLEKLSPSVLPQNQHFPPQKNKKKENNKKKNNEIKTNKIPPPHLYNLNCTLSIRLSLKIDVKHFGVHADVDFLGHALAGGLRYF